MLKKYLSMAFYNPHFILLILGGLSVTALSSAFTAQYVFDMPPCNLCLYQRIPFAVVILLAIMGIIATKKMGPQYGAFNIALCGIALMINSAIAFYHTGVEQHWWTSGCTLPDLSNISADQIMEAVKAAPTVSCDQIPWELFGISMAGYNVVVCLFFGLYALKVSKMVISKA